MFSLTLAIASLAGTAIVAATLLWLFLRFRRLQQEAGQSYLEMALLREQLQQLRGSFQEQLGKATDTQGQLGHEVAGLLERFNRVEMHAGLCVPPKPALSGFNINKRVEVIRMFQEGHSEETIAQQLAVPMGEVRLLIYLEQNASASAVKQNRRKSSSTSHAA